MRKLIETVQPLFENQNLGRLEEKLLDLTMEYAQTLSTIKDYYDDPSDDPHSMFSSQIEQFTEELQSLLNRLGFFQDSGDLAEDSTSGGLMLEDDNGINRPVDILGVDGVDSRDYPDFVDAFIYGKWADTGGDLSEEEEVRLNEENPELVFEMAVESFIE